MSCRRSANQPPPVPPASTTPTGAPKPTVPEFPPVETAVFDKPTPSARSGRCLSELKKEYPNISFDAIKDEDDAYFDSLGDERETTEALADRARELFAWLKDRPEKNIAVVRVRSPVVGVFACVLGVSADSPAELEF